MRPLSERHAEVDAARARRLDRRLAPGRLLSPPFAARRAQDDGGADDEQWNRPEETPAHVPYAERVHEEERADGQRRRAAEPAPAVGQQVHEADDDQDERPPPSDADAEVGEVGQEEERAYGDEDEAEADGGVVGFAVHCFPSGAARRGGDGRMIARRAARFASLAPFLPYRHSRVGGNPVSTSPYDGRGRRERGGRGYCRWGASRPVIPARRKSPPRSVDNPKRGT